MQDTVIRANGIGRLYQQAIIRIFDHGSHRFVRNFETMELTAVKLILTDPLRSILTTPERHLNHAFRVGEMIWIMTGMESVKQISYYNRHMARYSDDGVILAGAYGPRITPQLQYIIGCFNEDPETRQAVLTIWTPNPAASKDIPCTVMMHFIKVGNALDLIVYMRSNDIFLGLPYDIATFTTIQSLMAMHLNLSIGEYTHFVGSLHAYSLNFDDLLKIGKAEPSDTMWPLPGKQNIFENINALGQLENDIRTTPGDWSRYLQKPELTLQDHCSNILARWRVKKDDTQTDH